MTQHSSIPIQPIVRSVLAAADPVAWVRERNDSTSVFASLQGKRAEEIEAVSTRRNVGSVLTEANPPKLEDYFRTFPPTADEWKELDDYAFACSRYAGNRHRPLSRTAQRERMRQYCEVIRMYPAHFRPGWSWTFSVLDQLDEATLQQIRFDGFGWDAGKYLALYRYPCLRPMLRAMCVHSVGKVLDCHENDAFHADESILLSLIGFDRQSALRYMLHPEFQPTSNVDWRNVMQFEKDIPEEHFARWVSKVSHWGNLDDEIVFRLIRHTGGVAKALHSHVHLVIRAGLLPADFTLDQINRLGGHYTSDFNATLTTLSKYPDFHKHLARICGDTRVDPQFLRNSELDPRWVIKCHSYPDAAFLIWANQNHRPLFDAYVATGRFDGDIAMHFLSKKIPFDITQVKNIKPHHIACWLMTVAREERDAATLQLFLLGLPVTVPPHLATHAKALSSTKI